MYAIDLTGRHITHKLRVTYRMKSWSADKEDEIIEGYAGLIRHYPGGELWITLVEIPGQITYARSYKAVRIPFDAEVEILE